MKKFLLTAAVIAAVAGIDAAETTGKINTRSLNLRMESSLKSPVVGRAKRDEQVVITGKQGSWLELKAPKSVKVYVSEAYISKGKALIDLTMRSAMSAKAPDFGKLPKGTPVQVMEERAYGWVRIVPPDNLRVYAAAAYVTFDEGAVEKMAAAKTAAEVKDEAKASPAKPVPPAEKTVEKTAEQQAVKAPVKAQEQVKAQDKAPAKAPEQAKVQDKAPAKTQEQVKVQDKAPAKAPEQVQDKAPAKAPEQVKVQDKAPAKVQSKGPAPIKATDKRVKALSEFNIDALKTKAPTVSLQGVLLQIPSSGSIATNYALGGDNGRNLGFICAEEPGMLSSLVNKRVKVSGRKFTVKGWKAPIIWLDSIEKVK